MSIRTVLFDLDGTILDSHELIVKSFEHTFEQYNISIPREEIGAFNGPPLVETFSKLNPGYEQEMIKTYRKHNHELHKEYVKLFPHVIETIEQLQQGGVSIGIVTSKMRVAVELGMKLTGLDKLFNTIITVDDIKHAKPHPESVLKAMVQLQATADSTLMVGDNYHDILAGKNAGVKTAGVAWTHKGEDFLAKYEPNYMLQDMRDLLEIVGV